MHVAPLLELKIPPVALAAGVAGGMWACARLLPGAAFPLSRSLGFAIPLGVLGVAVGLAGVLAFRRHRTTVDPLHPDRASAVVDSGIYRLTRNPMYLGLALGLAGWGLYLGNWMALAGLPAFTAYLTRFQILPEERALQARFGAAFDAYRASVRRWL